MCRQQIANSASKRNFARNFAILLAALAILVSFSSDAFSQNFRWVKQAGGAVGTNTGGTGGSGVAADPAGNVYVSGYFGGTTTFGRGQPGERTLVTRVGATDIFLAKYDSAGKLLWAKQAGGTNDDRALGIAVDSSGNSYITGYLSFGEVTFGAGETNQTIFNNPPGYTLFLAKFFPDGNFAWVKRSSSTGADGYPNVVGVAIALDRSDNIYVTGNFLGPVIFGAGEASEITLRNTGNIYSNEDIFVAKFDSGGNLRWAKRAGGTNYESGWSIAVDRLGNSHVTGFFRGNVVFGLGESNQTTLSTNIHQDMFVARFDPDGNLLWAKGAGGPLSDDQGWGIVVDTLSNTYVTGYFWGSGTFGSGQPNQTTLITPGGFGDAFLAKYDPNGFLLWVKQITATGDQWGYGLALDEHNNIYVVGIYDGVGTFGKGEIREKNIISNNNSLFLAKFNSAGSFQWVKKAGGHRHLGETYAAGPAVASDTSRNALYVAGQFLEPSIYGESEPNQTTATPSGGGDAFLAKFSTGSAPAVDFDRDGKGDFGIYRDGLWAILRSTGGTTAETLGGASHIPVPGDYDGDGKNDLAVYLDGLWTIKKSTDGSVYSVGFGGPAFTPVPGDYDGDGKTDVAVYLDGVWSILRSSDGGNTVIAHGGPGWTPVPGDYDGDGKSDIAVYINGAWSILRSSNSTINVVAHGGPTWEPVPADYDGDGKADIAAYTVGAWSIIRSSDSGNTVLGHGGPSWVPVPADYDGDNKADIAVYNAAGAWSIVRSSNSTIQVVGHGGGPSDVPLN